MTRFAILALLAGCTSFDPITRSTCGNGLLEPGEDCDSHDASCVRCAVTCTTSADCPTTDYTCGTDGECHAPGGALAHPINAGTFEVNELRITDIDNDGAGDALGLSRTSIAIRRGAASGLLSDESSFVTPTQLGAPIFGQLDSDASLDLALTTRDGVVPFSSPYGALSPLAVPTALTDSSGKPLDIRMAYVVGPLTLGAIFVDQNTIIVGAVDFLNPNAPAAVVPCGVQIPASQLALDRVDVYQVNRAGDLATDVVVALQTTTGRVCVTAIHKDNLLAAAVVVDITPAAVPNLARKPILADLDTDSDRCPGLVNTDGGTVLRQYDGFMSGGHCVFETGAASGGNVLPAIPAGGANATAIGRIPLDPTIFTVASDGVVLTDGVYVYVPLTSSWSSIYQSARKLAGVASADLDRDGDIDAVLYAESSDDLDILYRSQSPQGYQFLRYDTASVVTSVILGDYDGNGIGDIAYTEKLSDHKRLMVAWGTPDQPLAPQLVGEIGDIGSIARLALPDTVDMLSVADDLIVLEPPMGVENGTLTLFHGSPQRSLLPYLDPRPGNPPVALHAAAVGRFGGDYPDIVTFAALAATGSAVQSFLVAGTSNGLTATDTNGVPVTGLAACPSSNSADVCLADASFMTWPASAGSDVVLAVDGERHAAVFDPASSSAIIATPATALASAIPVGAQVAALASGDVDGDGALDLVAAFAMPRGSNGSGAVLVCGVQAGVPQSCTDLVPVIAAAAPETTACVDAAPGLIGYRDPTVAPVSAVDVIVLCHDDGSSIYRVHHDSDGYHADRLAHSASLLTAIEVGDVTGDGVADVVALEGETGSQTLVVLRQCTSRDLQTCERASEGAQP